MAEPTDVRSSALGGENGADLDDPFVSATARPQREVHRYSAFDAQIFNLNSSAPSQVKRALEAHLAETERRLQEASKLGTALVQQQKELSDKLKEVEHQQQEGEIGPELRQRLAELEKEYNEIGRDSARVSLGPKIRGAAQDDANSTPVLEARPAVSPAVLSSQATNSPSKVSVPSRKQRNQPSSRVHDIEFATEISTSLLAQVRQLQALLAEREESLRTVNLEKSQLELEAEGFSQRLRALDESEQRYKDENWSLETQTHDLISAAKEASIREDRLTSNLNAAISEKNNLERELDEVKQLNGRLQDENTVSQKTFDSELHVLRRNVNLGEIERAALQQRVEELTGQNQELAKAVTVKFRQHEADSTRNMQAQDESRKEDDETPDNSPPPSPNKATPRHGHLESETLKSSLHHAHRMIQTLKSNIHREKTEKIELKRMLQDARDDLEQQRVNPNATSKRQKTKPDVFKKPPRPDMLGAGRKMTEIEILEPDWEDEPPEPSPTRKSNNRGLVPNKQSQMEYASASDAYQTANETEDGFETANERGTATESDAFQTGAESLAESSDDLTETEARADPMATLRAKRSGRSTITRPTNRSSFISTASTSADETDYAEARTPVQAQPPRYRIKMHRARRNRPSGASSHVRSDSGDMSAPASPASFNSNHNRTVSGGQSLFAELEGAGTDGEFDSSFRTNSFSDASTHRRESVDTQQDFAPAPAVPEVVMVDSSTMTDPSPPMTPIQYQDAASPALISEVRDAETGTLETQLVDASTACDEVKVADSATQCTPIKTSSVAQSETFTTVNTPPKTIWDDNVHHDTKIVPEPPISPVPSAVEPIVLEVSHISSENTSPIPQPPVELSRRPSVCMAVSTVAAEDTRPSPPVPITPFRRPSVRMAMSTIASEDTLPLPSTPPPPVETPRRPSVHMAMSSITTEESVPLAPPAPIQPKLSLELGVSAIQSSSTEPLTPPALPSVEKATPVLELSSIFAIETQPVEPEPVESLLTSMAAPGATILASEALPQRPSTAVRHAEESSHDISGPEDLAAYANGTSAEHQAEQMQTVDRGTGMDQVNGDLPADADIPSTSGPLPPRAPVSTTEIAAQTILTGQQIDKLLMERQTPRPVIASESKQVQTPVESRPSSPFATPRAKSQLSVQAPPISNPIHSPNRRPESAGSQRPGSASHPPLPDGHKQAIAAANAATQKYAAQKPPSENSSRMGPPLAPASMYRTNALSRPRTPSEQPGNGSIHRNAGAPKTQIRRSSLMSRRSSMSSFASELDDRFNLARPEYAFESGADPRMIQAITQTMIGEFLWKYTRKPGRADMSSTRHRRYFWVHPYTRTLYWGSQDPQSAGKSQQKAKSVAIEAVRVVTDDNPYPPGLHRRSLEIITPGRVIKFTAATSQRHETWFNALSYLLLRTKGDEAEEAGSNIIPEDIDEFYPQSGRTSRQTESRRSISSHNSRAARTISRQFVEGTPTLRVPPGRASPSPTSHPNSTVRSNQGSGSRVASMFKTPIMKGTFSSRRSRYGNTSGSIDGTSAASNDSTEELRRTIERQDREADRLENVRACCDGKHDVSSLSRTSRYSSRMSHHSHT